MVQEIFVSHQAKEINWQTAADLATTVRDVPYALNADGNVEAMLFSTVINKNGNPDFNKKFPHLNRQTGETKDNKNLRAIAPLDEQTFSMPVIEEGMVINPNSVTFITLTRDDAAPSAIAWKSMDDALTYYSGTVKVLTDAEVAGPDSGQANQQKIVLTFGCTDFDVVDRGRYLGRLDDLFGQMEDQGVEVSAYTLNTGAPNKEESQAIALAIGMGIPMDLQDHEELGISYVTRVLGFNGSPYFPPLEHQQLIDTWKDRRDQRRRFSLAKHTNFEKSGLAEPLALV
jgi:hypothetical protein